MFEGVTAQPVDMSLREQERVHKVGYK